MRRCVAFAGTILIAVTLAGQALAVQPDEVLPDAAMESRARALSRDLRCMVCQNQSIDDSDAPLARDLRILVRDRLKAGDSDRQVIDYLVDRYGEFVLLKPRIAWHTAALWMSPLLVLLIGVFALVRLRRRAAPPAVAGLTPDEQRRIERLLDGRQ
jgi:cytochrome c-type biogenesis protein CcmH